MCCWTQRPIHPMLIKSVVHHVQFLLSSDRGCVRSFSTPFLSVSSPLLSPFLPLPFPFPSLLLEVGPLNTATGSGGEPQRKSNLMHFSLKIWHWHQFYDRARAGFTYRVQKNYVFSWPYAPYAPCMSTPLLLSYDNEFLTFQKWQ